MNISSQTILLLVVIVLILGLALLRVTGKRHRRRMRRVYHPGRGLRKLLKRQDYGAEVAMGHGHKRSSRWPQVEREHRLREPACVACGHKSKVQVHHIKPFHLHPDLELDPRNLITLCEARGRNHHLLLGHLGDWKSYNEHIRHDIKYYYRKTAAQIKADMNWQKRMQQRP